MNGDQYKRKKWKEKPKKNRDSEEYLDDLEIISQENNPHQIYESFDIERLGEEPEPEDKTKILTEDDLRRSEEMRKKQRAEKAIAGDAPPTSSQKKAVTSPAPIEEDSGTGWVDDLLSDIILPDQEPPTQPKPKPKTIKAKRPQIPVPPRKKKHPQPSYTPTPTPKVDIIPNEVIDSLSNTPEPSPPLTTPVSNASTMESEPIHELTETESLEVDATSFETLKEQISDLQREIDEIMTTQTKMVKILIEIKGKLDQFEEHQTDAGWWSRVARSKKKK